METKQTLSMDQIEKPMDRMLDMARLCIQMAEEQGPSWEIYAATANMLYRNKAAIESAK